MFKVEKQIPVAVYQTLGGLTVEKNLFQQAKDAITNLMNMQGQASEQDKQAAKSAIESAYQEASPEEQQQLQQLEQQLQQNNQIK